MMRGAYRSRRDIAEAEAVTSDRSVRRYRDGRGCWRHVRGVRGQFLCRNRRDAGTTLHEYWFEDAVPDWFSTETGAGARRYPYPDRRDGRYRVELRVCSTLGFGEFLHGHDKRYQADVWRNGFRLVTVGSNCPRDAVVRARYEAMDIVRYRRT